MNWWNKLGVYRTLPVFFLTGAAIEWFMINVRVGKETFCKCFPYVRCLCVVFVCTCVCVCVVTSRSYHCEVLI